MSDKLSHLSEKQINELIDRYYNKEKISDLIKEFNISLKPSQLVKYFPPEILEIKCIYCDLNLIKSRQSRDYYWNKIEAICPNCGHEDNISCSCKNCTEVEVSRKEKDRQKKQELLNQILFYNEGNKIELDSLSFIEKIYLGSLLREGVSEDYNYIKPIGNFINPLAPTSEFQSEILNTLINRAIIVIHPHTDSEHIEIINLETGDLRYYLYEVKWALNVKKEGLNKVSLIDSIIGPDDLSDKDYDEAFSLWRKIALYESIEYFKHSVNNILGIDYAIGEKTISVLKDLLNDYSVSQIYGIIYRSINNALRFQVENGVSRKHAANTIMGNAQSFGERAKINKWELQKYKRIKECPETALSKFFFERIIKIGYSGFNEAPRKEIIQK